MRNILMAATMMLAATGAMTPAHALGLDAASKKTLAGYRLTDPGFQSFEAVMKEATAKGVPGLRDGDFMSKTSSIDGMAARLYGLPGMPAILRAHGLTAGRFAIIGLALAQGAIALTEPPKSPSVEIFGPPNPANMPFYKDHRAEIMALMDDGTSDTSAKPFDSSDATGEALKQETRGLNDRKMGACMKIGMVMSPISMEAMAGTIADEYPQAAAAAATPEYFATLHKQAKSILQIAGTVTDDQPKRDMQIAGNELELLASRHDLKFTPRLTRALEDYSDWMKANCSDTALHQ